jgi:hypothetical protein
MFLMARVVRTGETEVKRTQANLAHDIDEARVDAQGVVHSRLRVQCFSSLLARDCNFPQDSLDMVFHSQCGASKAVLDDIVRSSVELGLLPQTFDWYVEWYAVVVVFPLLGRWLG